MNKEKCRQRIRNLREDNDLTQKKVADYLGIRQNVYSRYEVSKNPYNKMSIDYLIELCYFYNISADYILGFTNEQKPLQKK